MNKTLGLAFSKGYVRVAIVATVVILIFLLNIDF